LTPSGRSRLHINSPKDDPTAGEMKQKLKEIYIMNEIESTETTLELDQLETHALGLAGLNNFDFQRRRR
jgi:hypothetical protein